MRLFAIVFALLATAALNACASGGSTVGSLPGPSGALDIDEVAAQSQALDRSLRAATLVNTNWAGLPQASRPLAEHGTLEATVKIAVASSRVTQSYHVNDSGGQAGVNLTPPADSYVALVATHDIYRPQTDIRLPLPPAGESEANFLYAPTTKDPNDACLEIGTSYYRAPGSSATDAYVFVYDFCGGPGATVAADGTFFAAYVTPATGSRAAHYQIEILEDASTSPPRWNARLYNVAKQRWDTIYTARGSFAGWDGRGWSMYETHYFSATASPVQCPTNLPTIGASNVHMVTARGGSVNFTSANSSLYTPEPAETSFGAWGDCFNADASAAGKTEAASESFNLVSANYSWRVVSSGH